MPAPIPRLAPVTSTTFPANASRIAHLVFASLMGRWASPRTRRCSACVGPGRCVNLAPMRRILITGATGQVGGPVAETLAREPDTEVVAIARFGNAAARA